MEVFHKCTFEALHFQHFWLSLFAVPPPRSRSAPPTGSLGAGLSQKSAGRSRWDLAPGRSQQSPVTVIGVVTIEYTGRMTYSRTYVSGTAIPGTPIPAGEPIDFTFQGTVEITPDCTGILRYSLTVMGTPISGQFIERF
jgi:hypothetical protein